MTMRAARRRFSPGLLLAILILGAAAPVQAAGPREDHSVLVTLGTQGGPIPSPVRSQPANLIVWQDHHILVDVGDGTAEQLAKADISLGDIDTIFISHLHFDHVGGLYGLLGMRYQVMWPGRLTIYGPTGTRELVDGLLAAMRPSTELIGRPPLDLRVVEIGGGESIDLDGIRVTSVRNSHYVVAEESGTPPRSESLSFRFDLPDRSIVYTGDTGPSAAVEALARGADMLVSEVMDPAALVDELRRERPDLPEQVQGMIFQHMHREHMAPEAVGLMAARAGVPTLVLTHMRAIDGEEAEARLKEAIACHYDGELLIAADLDRF